MNDLFPVHGGQLRRLSQRYGIPASDLLDFSANINPDGPPAGVLSALRSSLDDLSILTNYPDLDQTDLRQAIATYARIMPEQVVISNGFVPLLETILHTLPIKRCLLPIPAFNEYRKALTRAHIEVLPHTLRPENGFQYTIAAMLTGDHNAILLANPQNPSGVLCPLADILDLAAKAAQHNIYILLDEAFIDYAPGHSAASAAERFSNLIVFRSVTKFYGIPGLRVAYAVASKACAAAINKDLPPWPISSLASRAVMAALADHAYTDQTRYLNTQRRTDLAAALEATGIPLSPSMANFLLLRVPEAKMIDRFWERLLVEHHIVLRSCHDYEALAPGHFRVAVRTSLQNSQCVQAIATLLQG